MGRHAPPKDPRESYNIVLSMKLPTDYWLYNIGPHSQLETKMFILDSFGPTAILDGFQNVLRDKKTNT